MAKTQMPAPPIEILTEFLCGLGKTLRLDGTLSLVLRGSFLLRYWFGPLARPAADIDLECFQGACNSAYDRFGTPLQYAKTLCMHAAENWGFDSPAIVFEAVEVPDDGTCLWDYATPGERCYTGWVWNPREEKTGILQIDIAEAGSYDLDFISVTSIQLADSRGKSEHVPAYSPEMLLAAKLSWIVRGLERQSLGASIWNCELKDLFDAYLLVTKGKINAELFEKSMLAVAASDKLDWNRLSVLSDLRHAVMTDDAFPNWAEFGRRFAEQITCGPAEMLRVVAERIDPLLSGIRNHLPFLLAIDADPVDEVPYLIYADWLQDRGDPRGDFLRLAIQWYFHEDELSATERANLRQTLKSSLQKTPTPWLYHLFGGAERFRDFKQKIEA